MLAISAVPRGRNQYFVFASRKRGKYIFSWNHDRVLSLAILMRESQPNNWDFPKDVGAIIRDGTLKKTKIGQQFAAKLGSLFAADGENNAGPLQKMASGLLNCLLKGPESARVAVDVLLHAATVNNIISKIDSYPFANEVSFVFFFVLLLLFFHVPFCTCRTTLQHQRKKGRAVVTKTRLTFRQRQRRRVLSALSSLATLQEPQANVKNAKLLHMNYKQKMHCLILTKTMVQRDFGATQWFFLPQIFYIL